MRRRVHAVGAFYDSLTTLDESEATVQVFKVLMLRVAIDPERGRIVPDQGFRVMKSEGYGPFLPLRIFYSMDDDTTHLLQASTLID